MKSLENQKVIPVNWLRQTNNNLISYMIQFSIIVYALFIFNADAFAVRWTGKHNRYSAQLGIVAKGGANRYSIITFERNGNKIVPHVDNYAWYYNGNRQDQKKNNPRHHGINYGDVVYIFGKNKGWNSNGRPHLDVQKDGKREREIFSVIIA